MEYNKLSKKELLNLIESINKILNANLEVKNSNADKDQTEENPLENLIGTIPFLLTNKELFERNQDIADFAKKLDIYIPSPEKKKREDIIGRIILSISLFDRDKVRELHSLIKAVKSSNMIKDDSSNFFKSWEFIIKNIKI